MHFNRNVSITDFISRFGKPIFQRYKVNAGLQVSIEYGVDGKVAALEISRPGYRGYNFRSPDEPIDLSSEAVDQLLENLLPGITSHGAAREIAISTTYPGFSREIRRLPGTVLNRDYPSAEDRSKMIAATATINASKLSDPLYQIISNFGTRECEQFSAGTGLRVEVEYATDGSIQWLAIIANKSPLAHHDYATPIEQDVAEKLLDELLPRSIRSGESRRGVFVSGALTIKREMYDHVMISRHYVNEEMIALGASWPIDPSLLNRK